MQAETVSEAMKELTDFDLRPRMFGADLGHDLASSLWVNVIGHCIGRFRTL